MNITNIKNIGWDILLDILSITENILRLIPEKIFIIDKDKNIIYTNSDEYSDSVGKNMHEFFSVKDSEQFKKRRKITLGGISYDVKNHDFSGYKVLFLDNKKGDCFYERKNNGGSNKKNSVNTH